MTRTLRTRLAALVMGSTSSLLILGCTSEEARRQTTATPKVVEGKRVGAGELLSKSVVALVKDNSGAGRYVYGTAVVVGRRQLLTAAHNFMDGVDKAEIAIDSVSGPVAGVRIAPSQIAFHPDWAASLAQYNTPEGLNIPLHAPAVVGDLALVTLESDLPPSLVPVELDRDGTLAPTDTLVAVGHGWSLEPNAENRGAPSIDLTAAEFTVVSATNKDNASQEIHSRPVASNQGVCNGDSGGPLFKKKSNADGTESLVVVGILSRSHTGSCAGQQAIHTSVAGTAFWWEALLK